MATKKQAMQEYDFSILIMHSYASIDHTFAIQSWFTPAQIHNGEMMVSTFTGTVENDSLVGGAGADTLSGLAGNDTLSGGAGNDLMDGGDGNDLLTDGQIGYPAGTLVLEHFGYYAGSWTSQNSYPRMLGDVNGDGRDDIVGFASAGVHVALGNSDGTFTNLGQVNAGWGITGGWTNQTTYPRLLGDINGDGRADIVGFGQSAVYVAPGQADGHFGSTYVAYTSHYTYNAGWQSQDTAPRALGDVNGDGRVDIIAFTNNNVWVSLANANGTFAAPIVSIPNFGYVAGSWTSLNTYPREIGDVNGDGRADIVGFASGGIDVALGNADGTFTDLGQVNTGWGTANGWTSQNSHPRLLGDANGDGRADVFAFGQTGLWVLTGRADGHFDGQYLANSDYFNLSSGWMQQDTALRTVGDMNGDGIADIVGFSNYGVMTSLGRVGTDTLSGGAGDDTLSGGGGADVLDGGTGTDTATYAGSAAAVQVDLATGTGSGGDAQGDIYTGIENAEGGSGNDTLIGSGTANRLLGGGGNDTLSGAAGDDTLSGGAGGDVLAGGDGVDWAVYDGSSSGVAVSLLAGTASGGEAAGDTLGGVENLRGSAFADTLTGDGGANALAGGAGDDMLRGGLGNDTLTGGTGNDLFRFDVADVPNGVQADVVTDFTIGQDRIDYRDWGYNVNGSNAETYEWWRVRGVQILDDGDDVLITAYGGAYTLRLVGVDHAAFMSTGEANYLFL